MAGVMMVVGFLVIAGSLILGFNIFTDSNQSGDPLGLLDDTVSSFQRSTAYLVWIVGVLTGLFFIAIGRIIEILEVLVKAKEKSSESKNQ